MWQGFTVHLDRLVPATLLSDTQTAWRARFVVQAAVLGMLISVLCAGVYALGGLWPASVAVLSLAFLLPLAVVALRVTNSTVVASHVGLGLMLLTFTAPTLVERDVDGALLGLYALFPYLAVLLLDGRAGWVWLGIVLVTVTGVLISHELAWLPTVGAVHPRFVMLIRAGMLLSSVFLFGLRFARERERAMADLEQLSRAKGVFLANISHEIRTPMNGVLGLTEGMLHEELTDSLRERLGLVHRSGQALVALINDLLDLSKIEAGKLSVERVDFELSTLLRDLEHLFRPLATQKGLGFGFSVEGAPAIARGDSLRLRQVLSNLLNNALKFTEQGKVALEVTRLPAGVLRFSVNDTGIGIAPDVLVRLFAPFAQADASTTRRFGGTGLGLALSRDLVELMGGRMKVDTTPGVGSLFSFELELPEGTTPRPEATATIYPTPIPAKVAPILVVDDNVINLKVATALVERAGYHVITASNGRDALELVRHGAFTAVLMDCHMPVMDGFEATERIRGLSGPAGLLPIFAVTASAMPEELAACLRSGMNDCLTKPVSFDTLKKVLAQVEPRLL